MPDLLKQLLKAGRRERMAALKLGYKSLQRRPSPQPKKVELEYAVELQRQQREINAEVAAGAAQLAVQQKPEAFEPTKTKVLALLATGTALIASKYGSRTAAWNHGRWDRPVYNIVGVNAALPAAQQREMLDGWVSENVSLITGANVEQLARVESAVLRAVRSGVGGKELQKEIGEALKANRSRVNLIARDQIGKLSGQFDMAKQKGAGVTHYFWRTSSDERVRPEHAAREGQRFAWDSPPPGGHPGQAVRCRCTAEPDLDGLLLSPDELTEAEAIRQQKTLARRAELSTLQLVAKEKRAATRALQAAAAREAKVKSRVKAAVKEAAKKVAPIPAPKPLAPPPAPKPAQSVSAKPVKIRPEIAAEMEKTAAFRTERTSFRGEPLNERQRSAERLSRWVNDDPLRLSRLNFEEQREVFAWEWTHGSNRKLSVLMKEAAQKELGASGMLFNRKKIYIRPEWVEAARPAMRRIYEDTQASLKEQGVSQFSLFRGLKAPVIAAGNVESWTTKKTVARRFGSLVEESTFDSSRALWFRGAPGWMDGIYGDQQEVVLMRGIP